ncbi:hypothetical protein EUX98_g4539 [Antrodiella citrinella]|uniref:Uncharacterized protein n=1 Tax=Antrodiella citrinella TaxID=2447956 RepID=A0A4S4MTN7_9APHY|nr:hypothetical protein EUX98_g4539 [Antrodiella citrinella]
MSSGQRSAIFAAALTDVVQWLDYKTFGRSSWYGRTVLLLREASDVAPSLDDLKLDEARGIVRAALKERVLTAHPPDDFFEELAMPRTPVGSDIFASELDELDTVSGKDYAAQAARVEEKWAEADALWRKKAAPKVIAKVATRPRPTPKAAPPAVLPNVPSKRKDAPPSSDEEDFSPAPARSGTQKLVPSSLFALTSGRLLVGKAPALKKNTRKTSSHPERAVRRSRPALPVETDNEDDAQDEDDYTDSKPSKRDTGRAVKRSKGTKSEKEVFPDEDPTAEVSDCGAHKQSRDSAALAAISARADSQPQPLPSSSLFVASSEATHPAFRVDSVSYVEEFPSCLAALRRRAALARVHPSSHPASRAIADVVEQSLANAQIQMTTGLCCERAKYYTLLRS